MSEYVIRICPPEGKMEHSLVKFIGQQLEKDLFIAVRAFDVQVKDLRFSGERFILFASGKLQAINDLITFILLRLSEKTRQVLYRSYSVLKANAV